MCPLWWKHRTTLIKQQEECQAHIFMHPQGVVNSYTQTVF